LQPSAQPVRVSATTSVERSERERVKRGVTRTTLRDPTPDRKGLGAMLDRAARMSRIAATPRLHEETTASSGMLAPMNSARSHSSVGRNGAPMATVVAAKCSETPNRNLRVGREELKNWLAQFGRVSWREVEARPVRG
jgi:hypothetical protein